MLRSALAAIALLAILLLSRTPADAHSLACSSIPGPRQSAEFETGSFSQTHDASPCCPDGAHGLLCRAAGACSPVGCLAIVEPAVFPVTPEKLAYDLFEGSRPDGTGIAPDLPPPRAIV
jgi:hypothetical protein